MRTSEALRRRALDCRARGSSGAVETNFHLPNAAAAARLLREAAAEIARHEA